MRAHSVGVPTSFHCRLRLTGWRRAARTVLTAFLLGMAGAARAAPPDTSGLGFSPQPGTSLPLAAVLREADGRDVVLRQLVGVRPVLLALGYFSCPALCGVVRDDLFAALAGSGLVAGRDYTLLFVSIDPAEGPADAQKAATPRRSRRRSATAAASTRG